VHQAVSEPLCLANLGQAEVVVSGWSDGAVRCFDAVSGEEHWSVAAAHRGPVTTMSRAASLKFFVTGGESGEVKVWDIHTREQIAGMNEHTGRITHLQMFGDGVHLLSASRDRTLVVSDLRTRRKAVQCTLPMGHVTGAFLCPNQTNVLSVGTDRRVTLWDLRQTDPARQTRYTSDYAEAYATCIAPDHAGRYFATGGTDEAVKLWDMNSLAEIADCPGHSETVNCLQFSPDGKQLISGGADRSLFVWNLYS